ncbi:MAG: hypothetical protein PVJ14_00420 [Chromatiales bacterium]|jgi:hypothetical protein
MVSEIKLQTVDSISFPELIPDIGFSAYDSGQDAASDGTAWDAPEVASVGPVVSTAVSQVDARSGAPVGLAVGVAAAAR